MVFSKNGLHPWSQPRVPKGYTMLISDDLRIADPCLFQLFPGFTNFCAYPKDGRLLPLAEQRDPIVLANEFVWETLLFDNYAYTGDMTVREPLYICNVCNTYYEIFDEFFTHLKSEEHRTQVRSLAASSAFTIITFCKIVMYLVCVCVCSCLIVCPSTTTRTLNIFAKFAIISPSTIITCSSIPKVKNIIGR